LEFISILMRIHDHHLLKALAERYQTPLYVYDTAVIQEKIGTLRGALSSVRHRINYACKANTNLAILRFMHAQGICLDTVSIEEVKLGKIAGYRGDEMIYTPNSVGMEEVVAAVEEGAYINIDNISILEYFGERYGGEVPICIRINPHVMGGGHLHISTGHIDSKFGISIHQMRHVERIVKHHGLRVTGLHMHTGSDILDIEVFLRAADILFEHAEAFPDLELLDFGSGFKVAYKPDDYCTDVHELGVQLCDRFKSFCVRYGRDLELWFEPGKFLVSESGNFLARVTTLKQTTSAMFVGIDTGLNHLIRPMLYGAYHHIVNVSNPQGRQRIYTVVGNICETDTFGWDRKLNEVREGDLLCFANAGAYGMTMASNYNSRCRPAEVLLHEGKDYLIRRRETLEDQLALQLTGPDYSSTKQVE
jgi:diaminopimelate decarboxylase